MLGTNNNNSARVIKKILMKIKPRFSLHYVSYTALLFMVVFSTVHLVTATTPNPGHPWTEVGDGNITFTDPATPVTYTGPTVSATLLTTANLVTPAQGGTGIGTYAVGDLIYASGATTLAKLADVATGSCLISGGVATAPLWGSCTSGGIAWSAITNPTTTQSLTFDDGELNAWTVSSDTETFHTITANSLTTGKVLSIASSSLTTGSLIDLAITGTAASVNQTGLNISLSGANASPGVDTYGIKVSNTHTDGSSLAVNNGVYASTTGQYGVSITGTNSGGGIGVLGSITSSTNFGAAALSGTVAGDGYGAQVTSARSASTGNFAVTLESTTTGTFNTGGGVASSYAGYFSSTTTRSAGASALTNIGLYATASGAQNNYAAIFDAGNVGIGTASPAEKLEVAGNVKITGGALDINVPWPGAAAIVLRDTGPATGSWTLSNMINGSGFGMYNGDGGFYQFQMFVNGTTFIGGNTYTANTAVITAVPGVGVGIFNNSPTAALQLPAGTATASTAPLKFTSGTNLTAAEAGAMEWDGTNLFITQTSGPTRKTLAYTDIVSGTNTGDVTLSAIGATPNANGATLTGQVLNLQPADGSFGGVVTTTTQTFAGVKTFTSDAIVNTLTVGLGTGAVATNTAVGYQTLNANSTGANNTALGYQALLTSASNISNNTAIGSGALKLATAGSNTAVGYSAGGNIAGANENTAVGYAALNGVAGNANVAVGAFALQLATGTLNVAVGYDTLHGAGAGTYNIGIGRNVMGTGPSGSHNVGIEQSALLSLTSGSYNIAIGQQAGYAGGGNSATTVDDYGIFLGYLASRDSSIATATPLTNIVAIGKNAKVATSNSIVLGGTGADAMNVGIGFISPTARLNLPAGTTTAGTAPLKFTSGTNLTAAEAGAVEFTTDDLFFTITTGAARKRLLMADPVGGLTSTRVPFATTNGRLTDGAGFTFDGTSALTLGFAGTGTGALKLSGTTSGTITLTTAAAAGTYSWQLPTADSAGCIQSNGTGTLSIASCGGGAPAWNSITAPTGDLTLAMDSDVTTFNYDTLTTQNAFTLASTSITSGKLLSLSSSAAANFTGSLGQISLSDGTGASSNTGSLLTLTNAGTANANTAMIINHYATGTGNLAFRVNDVSGDTTPFIIDGTGNVGIGTSSATSTLTVAGTSDFTTSGTGGFLFANSTASSTSGTLRLNTTASTDFIMGARLSTTQTATGALTASYGLQNLWSSSAVVTGGGVGQTAYGIHNSVSKIGADTATGTYTLYGSYNAADNTGRTDAGTVNTYGGYFSALGDTAGTSKAIGLYATASGADSNYAAVFDQGNVGIGTAAPAAKLEVTGNTFISGVLSTGTQVNALSTYSSAVTYKTTNGGGTITPSGIFGSLSYNTAGNKTLAADETNGFLLIAGNGTSPIARAAIDITNLTNGAGTETGDLIFSTKPSGAAITERMRISSTGVVTIPNFTAANGVIYASSSGVLAQTATNAGATLCLTQASSAAPAWGSCGGGGSSWDTIASPAGNQALTFGATEITTWDATAYTTERNLNFTMGTSLTTGGAIGITGASYNPGAGNTGNLINLAYTNASTSTSGTSITTGINLAPTLTATGASGTHDTYGIRIQDLAGSPTGAGTQNQYGIRIGNQGKSNTESSYGLYVDAQSGSTNSYAAAFVGGKTLMGVATETTSSSRLYMENSLTNETGSTTAIAGIHENLTFASSSGTNTQVGNRLVLTNSGSVANTLVGQIVRVLDNTTSLANTVRGIEVVASAGSTSSTTGTNTGIRATGGTFGVQGITTGLVGGTLAPAALYGQMDGTTQGDALRLYSTTITSAPQMAYFYHDTSTFTGNAITMDMATGSGAFTGNFLDFQNNNTQKLTLTSKGELSLLSTDADNATGLTINTEESTAGQVVFKIETDANSSADTNKFKIDASGATYTTFINTSTAAACHATNGTTTVADEIVDCAGSVNADFAELYPVEAGVEYGDIVATGTEMVNTYDAPNGNIDWNKEKGQITKLVKSNKKYQSNTIGIVSNNYGDFTLAGHNIKDADNPMPIALNGRVPVKISSNSSTISPGDYITTSEDQGKAEKATKGGFVIGKALEAWTPESGVATIMVYVEQGFYDGKGFSQFAGIDPVDSSFAKKVLKNFMNSGSTDTGSEMTLDRLLVGVEIVTPKLTADTIATNIISAGTGKDIGLILSPEGKLMIGGQTTTNADGTTAVDTSNPAITFDALGNATFTGKVTAKEIEVNSLAGIQDITDQINELSEGQAAFTLTAQVMNTLSGALTIAQADILKLQQDLGVVQQSIAGLTTNSTDLDGRLKLVEAFLARDESGTPTGITTVGLSVSGDGKFTGKTQFDGLSFFSNTTSFTSGVNFNGQVEFALPPLYNKDSAGYALVKQGDRRAKILFESPYIATPVVNTSITFETGDNVDDTEASTLFGNDVRFIVTSKDQTGFTILLNKNAPRDIRFSWNALAVRDPSIFESVYEGLIIDPTPPANNPPADGGQGDSGNTGDSTPPADENPPTDPTCTDPQVLDTSTNTCVDPTPDPAPTPDETPASDPTPDPTPDPAPAA